MRYVELSNAWSWLGYGLVTNHLPIHRHQSFVLCALCLCMQDSYEVSHHTITAWVDLAGRYPSSPPLAHSFNVHPWRTLSPYSSHSHDVTMTPGASGVCIWSGHQFECHHSMHQVVVLHAPRCSTSCPLSLPAALLSDPGVTSGAQA